MEFSGRPNGIQVPESTVHFTVCALLLLLLTSSMSIGASYLFRLRSRLVSISIALLVCVACAGPASSDQNRSAAARTSIPAEKKHVTGFTITDGDHCATVQSGNHKLT